MQSISGPLSLLQNYHGSLFDAMEQAERHCARWRAPRALTPRAAAAPLLPPLDVAPGGVHTCGCHGTACHGPEPCSSMCCGRQPAANAIAHAPNIAAPSTNAAAAANTSARSSRRQGACPASHAVKLDRSHLSCFQNAPHDAQPAAAAPMPGALRRSPPHGRESRPVPQQQLLCCSRSLGTVHKLHPDRAMRQVVFGVFAACFAVAAIFSVDGETHLCTGPSGSRISSVSSSSLLFSPAAAAAPQLQPLCCRCTNLSAPQCYLCKA